MIRKLLILDFVNKYEDIEAKIDRYLSLSCWNISISNTLAADIILMAK